MRAFVLNPAVAKAPAFVDCRKRGTVPLTGSVFNDYLKRVANKAGLTENLSSHSFRRGSATWALSCGIPGEVVKLLGDWRSTAYLAYVDQIPQHVQDFYRLKFCKSLPTM